MNNSDLNTEQIILEAAEAEFLEKGYSNAKMMSIAKRAGVSHSMLHYYFRSKENLFQTIYLKKAQTISQSFGGILEQHLPFFEIIKNLVEVQFDFVAQNPKLPHFILTEVVTNRENRMLLFEVLAPKALELIPKFKRMLDEEINKGTVRPVDFYFLIMNIISINVSTFVILPVLQDMITQNGALVETFLNARKESNVQFILNALRP